ncbi:CLUMA_CG000542, isoform A [Clunio marinus]|uniref:Metalloendopeptidase n=1 Tax=Clunio marinus TaxID=568069 RepID=A0A1J1HFC1_9DIPT|nr:CLUMA_CG000542, isoform A [Clunio marinus]
MILIKCAITLLLVQSTISKPFNDPDTIIFREENDVDSKEILSEDDPDEVYDASLETTNIGLEAGEYFQGDIVITPQLLQAMFTNDTSDDMVTRTGILFDEYRWPKNYRREVTVPYVFNNRDYTTNQKNLMKNAMKGIEKYTCIRFVARSWEKDYIKIKSGDGCSANMGKQGGEQEVSLANNGCMSKGIVQHELIHVLGYDHMHSHFDRDRYVDIKWENIKPNVKSNFDKVNPRWFGNFGTTYDLYSVMHYHGKAFSKNGRETIVPRNRNYARIMGQRKGLSSGDVKRINNMYKCYQ